jgi:hypothetical protein
MYQGLISGSQKDSPSEAQRNKAYSLRHNRPEAAMQKDVSSDQTKIGMFASHILSVSYNKRRRNGRNS